MLSRVALKPRLCWSCLKTRQPRLITRVPVLACRSALSQRLYSAEPNNSIQNILGELIEKKQNNSNEEGGQADRVDSSSSTAEDEVKANDRLNQGTNPTELKIFNHSLLQPRKLSIEALGEEVEALVIKNPNQIKLRKSPLEAFDDQPSSSVDLDALSAKDGSASEYSSDVWQNLEELRPPKQIVSLEKFDQVLNDLVAGFTKNQLMHYYTEESEQDQPAQEPQSTTDYPWLLKRNDWVVDGITDYSGLTPKQSQALLIMMKRWGMKIKEHVESLGHLHLWLRPDAFALLTRSRTDILEALRSSTLSEPNGEKIIANPDQTRLSFLIPEAKVPFCLARLDDYLQRLETRRVPAKSFDQSNLTLKVLTELGRITNTYIEYDKESKELQVTFIPSKATDGEALDSHTQVEDSVDTITRLLLAASPYRARRAKTLIITPEHTPANAKTKLIQHNRERRSMSWRNRLLNSWYRNVFHLRAKTGQRGRERSLKLHTQVYMHSLPAPLDEGVDNQITATFGHVLHSSNNLKTFTNSDVTRVLAPVVPHPAAFTHLSSDAPIARATSIILNFTPKNTEGGAPEVRLKLPVEGDTDLANFAVPPNATLYAEDPWDVKNVLLPANVVDVRFSQKRIYPLDKEQDSVRAFIAASKFNLPQGQLQTPSHIDLTMPAQWASGRPPKEGADPIVTVPYVFMGLEVRQSADLDFDGHILRYTSVEAGQHGGQRQELSLVATPGDGSSTVSRSRKLQFIQLVDAIVTGRRFSWSEGHKLVVDRSAEELDIELEDEDVELAEAKDETTTEVDTEHGEGRSDPAETKVDKTTEVDTELKDQYAELTEAKDEAKTEITAASEDKASELAETKLEKTTEVDVELEDQDAELAEAKDETKTVTAESEDKASELAEIKVETTEVDTELEDKKSEPAEAKAKTTTADLWELYPLPDEPEPEEGRRRKSKRRVPWWTWKTQEDILADKVAMNRLMKAMSKRILKAERPPQQAKQQHSRRYRRSSRGTRQSAPRPKPHVKSRRPLARRRR